MFIYLLFLCLCLFVLITAILYNNDKKAAYKRLDSYHAQSINTQFGKASYVEKGQGEAILISHGIFGGFDQGYVSLNKLFSDNYRKISVSRFGYPGSDIPQSPTPQNQAEVFRELLDTLGIEQSYILCTSAGGAAGMQFALKYPERTKGLILLSSGGPDRKRTPDEIEELGMMGPPELMVNDFPMWFCLKYFGFIFNSMLGSGNNDQNLLDTMLPVQERRQGVIADTKITNIDMTLNYEQYPLEKLTCPILVIHAKDDPMAKYENIEIFLGRVEAETLIYETGGHMIHGHDCSAGLEAFINKTKKSAAP